MHREEYTNKCQFRDLSQSKHPYKYKQHPDQEIQILSNISKLSLCPLPDPSPRKKNHHAANRYRFITWLSFHSIFFVRDIQIVAHSNFSFSFLKISPLNTISFYPTYTLCLETVWYIFFSSFPCNLFVFFKKAYHYRQYIKGLAFVLASLTVLALCSVTSVVFQLFATPWTIACQAPLSTGFSRQEYWSSSIIIIMPNIIGFRSSVKYHYWAK